MVKNSKKGFTLVEMMLVIAIITILAVATTFGLSKYLQYADEKSAMVAQKGDTYDQAELAVNAKLGDSTWSMPQPTTTSAPVGGGGGAGGGTAAPTANPTTTTAPTTSPAATTAPAGGGGGGGGGISTPVPTTSPNPTTTTAPTTAPGAGGSGGSVPAIDPELLGSGVIDEDGMVKYGDNIKVDPAKLTKTGKGVNSIVQQADGSYTLKIQNDQWNAVDCKIEINIGSDGKITFTGGNKYILSGFRNDLWAGDTFELGQNELNYLKTEYGLQISN